MMEKTICPSDGIIIRSKVGVPFSDEISWEYWLVTEPLRRKSMSRKDAMTYVEDHGLVMTLNCKDGQVWDTPDESFKRQWAGFASNHWISIRALWG